MDSLEQAREALAKHYNGPEAVRIIDAGYKALDYDRAMAISKHDVWTILKGALAALSRPVEGVKEEPFIFINPRSMVLCSLQAEGFVPLYMAPPVAESEALRERVAELEAEVKENYRLYQGSYRALHERAAAAERKRDALAEAIGKDRTRLVVERTAAEARLAQAERGPAVTEAMAKAAIRAWENHRDRDPNDPYERWVAALEAALHPQSAAGEEGKP